MRKLLMVAALLSGMTLSFFLSTGKLPWNYHWNWQGFHWKWSLGKEEPPKPTIVYQWRDEFGRMQMSSEPPPEGVDYKVVETKGISNKWEDPMPAPAAPSENATTTPMNSLSGYVQDARKAVDASNRVQEETRSRIDQETR